MNKKYGTFIAGMAMTLAAFCTPAICGAESQEESQEALEEMEITGLVSEVGEDYLVLDTGYFDEQAALGDLDLESLLEEEAEMDEDGEIVISLEGEAVLELDGMEETVQLDEETLVYQLADLYTDIEVVEFMEDEEEEDLEEEDSEDTEDVLEEEFSIELEGEEEEGLEEEGLELEGEDLELEEEGLEDEDFEEELLPISLEDIEEGDIVSVVTDEEGRITVILLQKAQELEETLEESEG